MRRDLAWGVAWFVGLFVYDAATSTEHLESALRKARHAPGAATIVKWSVGEEVGRMFLAYILMGLVAGIMLWVVQRVRCSPRPWLDRLLALGGVTAWMSLRGAISFPLLYLGVPGVEWLANNVSPLTIDVLFAALGAPWVLWGFQKRRPHPGWLAALALLVVGVALADNHPPAATPRHNEGPNIIVIGIDALRPDHLAHYGYERDTAPTLEAYLDQAAVFENAVTPLPRTWPAYSTVLSGVDPITHGQRVSLPPPGLERPRVDIPMLTDLLKEQGYHTRFMTDDSRFSYMVPEHNFDVIQQPPVNVGAFALSGHDPHFRTFFTFLHGPVGWSIARAWRYNQAFGAVWTPGHFAESIADSIAEASEHDRFFLTVHACTLHAPAARTWPYHKLYGMSEYGGNNRFRYRSTGSKIADGDKYGDAEIQKAEQENRQQNLNLYDSGIAQVDETWERIDRALREGGLYENSLIFVISDHGEDFIEDSLRYKFRGPNHGYHAWGTGQTRIVFAVHGDGFETGDRSELVSLADIAPTAARFAGIDMPTAEGQPLQDPIPERIMFGETGVSESWYRAEGHIDVPIDRIGLRYAVDPETKRVYQQPDIEAPMIAAKDFWALDNEWWLVRESLIAGPRYSLFRWHDDPTFATDLAAEHPDQVQRLALALHEHLGEPVEAPPEQGEVAHAPAEDTALPE